MRILLASLLSATFLAVPAHSAEPESQLPSIAHTTIFSGSSTASMRVHVPENVRINVLDKMHRPQGPNPDIRIRASGRYTGVVFVREGWEGRLRPEEVLIAGRWALCDAPNCDPGGRVVNDVRGLHYTDDQVGFLQEGDYTVHLITEGPARVRFTFRSAPDGEVHLRPTDESGVEFHAPPVTFHRRVGSNYAYGSGAEFNVGEVGLTASMLYVRSRQKLNDFSGGVCQIDSPTAPPERWAYGPQCYPVTTSTGTQVGPGYHFVLQPIDDYEFTVMPVNLVPDGGRRELPNIDGRRGLGGWTLTPYKLEDFIFMGFSVPAPAPAEEE